MDIKFIKDTVFETVDFSYDKEIEFFEFDGVKVEYDGKTARIGAKEKAALARGCFLFAMNISEGKKSFEIEERAHFPSCGTMVDCSRNGVMKVEAVKRYINCMASLGLNYLMLYTEDTYEIENRPLFGYLRGRYTKLEIQEMVAYGEKMGVELVPCIQTLGHLRQYLKWGRGAGQPDYTGENLNDIKNTDEVLLCGEEETYRFIEDAVKACREAYKTDRIHIGMDEATDIASGRYLRLHGIQDKNAIMTKHLDRVVKICNKYGFKPMMWSDMFFRINANGSYGNCNFEFPEGFADTVPDVKLMYWSYSSPDKSSYDGMFKKHHELGREVTFAGAINTYFGFLPIFECSYRATTASMQSCLENNVKTVVCTLWGDNGNETNAFLANPLLPVYSEHCYKGKACTEEDVARASEFLTKMKFEDYKKFGRLTYTYDTPLRKNDWFIGRRLFYGDVLYDMSVTEESCDRTIAIFNESIECMKSCMEKKDVNEKYYRYAYLVYSICALKAELRKNLRSSYQKGDRKYLEKVLNEYLPRLISLHKEFLVCHKEQWYETYKPFGFEVLSFRYGGIISRLNDAVEALDKYLSGKIDKIDELEEKIVINEDGYAALVNELVTPTYQI